MYRYLISIVFAFFSIVALAQDVQQEVTITTTSTREKISDSKGNFSPFGIWRGSFQAKNGAEIPFNFEIKGNTAKDAKVFFLNAEEHFEAGVIKQTDDSLFISINTFDNLIALAIDPNNSEFTGVLRKQDGSGTPIPVKAEKGNASRFKVTGPEPIADISGTYDVVFKGENGKDEKAVGLFKQEGKKLKATFLRITGDSRYLEGIVEGNNFSLSSFIGSGPSFYKGTFTRDGKLEGQVIGLRGSQDFNAVHNEEAALPNPYSLTYLKEGYKTLDFSLPDVNGKKISPSDAKYKNKVLIVTITGSWCPNCIDEASFLAPWYINNKKRGIEIISIHYERKNDPEYVKKAITRFKEKFNIQYDEVFGGLADKQTVAESLPALNSFLSFPTTILIGRDGKVAKIHTGYSGPATGKYYDQFVKEFNEDIDGLLK